MPSFFSRLRRTSIALSTEELLLEALVLDLARNETPFVFKAANERSYCIPYELSATNKGLGDQLTNTSDGNQWQVKHIEQHVYAIESISSPGLFIGFGERGVVGMTRGYEAVLVSEGDSASRLRLRAARNGSSLHLSFGKADDPRYLLNHCNGLMWFFKEPANSEDVFSNDASWTLEQVETVEMRVQRLPLISRAKSENSTGMCPICFVPWGEEAVKVVTECDHAICIQCIMNICKMRPPSTEGECAICRDAVTLDGLKRVMSEASAPPMEATETD